MIPYSDIKIGNNFPGTNSKRYTNLNETLRYTILQEQLSAVLSNIEFDVPITKNDVRQQPSRSKRSGKCTNKNGNLGIFAHAFLLLSASAFFKTFVVSKYLPSL